MSKRGAPAGSQQRAGTKAAKTPVESRAIRCEPLTADRWADLEQLFGARGACGGCWCMYWRCTQPEFERGKGRPHHDAFQAIVQRGGVPGVLAYFEGQPAGWCAIEPRSAYVRLARSRTLAPVDEQPVWSVTCFFVKRECRQRGVSVALLQAAVAHAAKCGAQVVEGYPVQTRTSNAPAPFIWTGTLGAFRAAGFVEVARRSATRPIMRFVIGTQPRGAGRTRGATTQAAAQKPRGARRR